MIEKNSYKTMTQFINLTLEVKINLKKSLSFCASFFFLAALV